MNQGASWQFQVLSFPVRVHFSFLLIAILLGLNSGNLILIVFWVVIVFVSILLHELGHALVMNFYGQAPRIEMYMMGGLTIPTRFSMLTYPQEILVSFAGPLTGFLFGGLIFAIIRLVPLPNVPYLRELISDLLFVNIFWGIINLIPTLPLDGGNIMRSIYHWVRNPYDERVPLIISMVVAILAALASLVIFGRGGIFITLLFAWFTFNNYNRLRGGYQTDIF